MIARSTRITFIRPNMNAARSHDAMEPLVFALLSGLTPEHIERELVDERLEDVDTDLDTDLVAMTVETYTARRAYEISDLFRMRGVPVVMGGFHPTFAPEEALAHADAVVIGDAEDTWPPLLRDLADGKLQRIYRSSLQMPLTDLHFDRSIFAGKRYLPIKPVQFGRGCRFACDFCSINAFYGRTLRQRPPSDVAREIEALHASAVFLVDDNLFVDRNLAARLFRELAPLEINWVCQTSIDIADDPPLLDLMAESGCVAALIGFESLNEKNLRQMGKRWNVQTRDYHAVVRRFRDRGIMMYGTFVFGYDHDTTESFDETARFAIDAGFCLANFNPLTPTPGTPLYDRLRREDRLLFDSWWLDPRFTYGSALFKPVSMTADELTAGCFRARRRFYGYPSMLRRAADRRANTRNLRNLGLFALANYVSRREIYRKQGMSLGEGSTILESRPNRQRETASATSS